MSALAIRMPAVRVMQSALRASAAVLLLALATAPCSGWSTSAAAATAAATSGGVAIELPARLELFVGDSRVLQANTTH